VVAASERHLWFARQIVKTRKASLPRWFLEKKLEGNWEKYPGSLRNRLLTLLVDRVELRHDLSHIEAMIVWKVGFRGVKYQGNRHKARADRAGNQGQGFCDWCSSAERLIPRKG
jgi:hypothetical protein